MRTMKAMRVHDYNEPDSLKYEEVARPEPTEGEVLVRVHAAGINSMDRKMREGDETPRILPFIPGWDISGVVQSVGPGVTRLLSGDEVFGRPDIARNGGYAEYIAVAESELVLKPKSLDHIQAAAIPLPALAAWQALFDAGQLIQGHKVLIHAANTSAGIFATQLAKWKGATVVGVASTRNQEFLKEIGVDQCIDHEKTRFEHMTNNIDIVIDTVGGDTQKRSWPVLKKGGILVSLIDPPRAWEAEKYGVRQAYVAAQPNPGQLEQIADLADMGVIIPVISEIFPLSRARDAENFCQSGHVRGKTILRIA